MKPITEQRRQELIADCESDIIKLEKFCAFHEREGRTALLESYSSKLERQQVALASLTAVKSPMMFIDGDISPESADKLAKVIQEFNKSDDGPMENIPAIPDGYVVVPREPTEEMIIRGFESCPSLLFSDEEGFAEYEAMSGCQQAAHKAKLCWHAMVDAATSK